MESNNCNNITTEWLKANGWRCYQDTANKTINGLTYYLRNVSKGDVICNACYLSKQIALVAAVEVVEMLTDTGQEFDEDKIIPFSDGHTPISRSWGRESGWDEIENGVCIKCINGAWYELEYTDFDCDYILKKRIATVTDISGLEALVK